MSNVGLACERNCAFCHGWVCVLAAGCQALKQIAELRTGGKKRNEGSNERSFVKDTVAAVRNEEELQAA